MLLRDIVDERVAVVSPSSYKRELLRERQVLYPEHDILFLSKEDLLAGLTYDYGFSAVDAFSKNEGVSYGRAEEQLRLGRWVELAESKDYPRLSEAISKLDASKCISRNGHFRSLLSGRSFVVVGYGPNDSELTKILGTIGISPAFLTSERLEKEHEVYSYKTRNIETKMAFEDMASLIYKKELEPKDIHVVGNGDYVPYVRRYSRLYGIPVNGLEDYTLAEFPLYKTFIGLLSDGKSLEEALSEIEEDLEGYGVKRKLNALAVELRFLEDDSKQLVEAFEYKASKTKVRGVPYINAVSFVSEKAFVAEGERVYYLGFNEGNYPKGHKDDDFVSDREKKALGMMTSSMLNEKEREKGRDILFSKGNVRISCAQKADKVELYPSPLMQEKPIELKDDLIHHSSAMAKLAYGIARDRKELYSFEDPAAAYYVNDTEAGYRSYSHEFKPFGFKKIGAVWFSPSSFKSYGECPFKYFASKLLNAGIDEFSVPAKFGDLVHHALEVAKGGHVDFEDLAEKSKELFDGHDTDRWISLNRASYIEEVAQRNEEFRQTSRFHDDSRREGAGGLDAVELEKDKLYLTGRSDKIMVDEEDGYSIIVDYKSGNYAFDPMKVAKGLDIQLPSYALMIQNDKNLCKTRPVGMYVQSIGPNKNDPLDKRYLLNGITVKEDGVAAALDPTLDGKKVKNSRFVQSLGMSSKGYSFRSTKLGLTQGQVDQLIDGVKKCLFLYADKVRNGEFQIRPYREGQTNGCKYCEHRNICYRKIRDFVDSEVKVDIPYLVGSDDEGEE